jgi:hypothetical protein
MKNKINNSLLCGLILASTLLAACNGTSNSSGSQTNTVTINPSLSGLTYDQVSKSVYSVDQIIYLLRHKLLVIIRAIFMLWAVKQLQIITLF